MSQIFSQILVFVLNGQCLVHNVLEDVMPLDSGMNMQDTIKHYENIYHLKVPCLICLFLSLLRAVCESHL